jgi:hypothetical protein
VIPGLEIPPQYGWPILTGLALAVVGYAINRALKNRPGAPTVTEAWEETRKVKAETGQQIHDLQAAFNVTVAWIDRASRDWGKTRKPPAFSAEERAIIDKIRPLPEPLEEGETL